MTDRAREEIASKIIVDCGYDSEYPCPHAHPTMGYEKCPHEDKDICMWQLEQADQFLTLSFNGYTIADLIELAENATKPMRLIVISPETLRFFIERSQKYGQKLTVKVKEDKDAMSEMRGMMADLEKRKV